MTILTEKKKTSSGGKNKAGKKSSNRSATNSQVSPFVGKAPLHSDSHTSTTSASTTTSLELSPSRGEGKPQSSSGASPLVRRLSDFEKMRWSSSSTSRPPLSIRRPSSPGVQSTRVQIKSAPDLDSSFHSLPASNDCSTFRVRIPSKSSINDDGSCPTKPRRSSRSKKNLRRACKKVQDMDFSTHSLPSSSPTMKVGTRNSESSVKGFGHGDRRFSKSSELDSSIHSLPPTAPSRGNVSPPKRRYLDDDDDDCVSVFSLPAQYSSNRPVRIPSKSSEGLDGGSMHSTRSSASSRRGPGRRRHSIVVAPRNTSQDYDGDDASVQSCGDRSTHSLPSDRLMEQESPRRGRSREPAQQRGRSTDAGHRSRSRSRSVDRTSASPGPMRRGRRGSNGMSVSSHGRRASIVGGMDRTRSKSPCSIRPSFDKLKNLNQVLTGIETPVQDEEEEVKETPMADMLTQEMTPKQIRKMLRKQRRSMEKALEDCSVARDSAEVLTDLVVENAEASPSAGSPVVMENFVSPNISIADIAQVAPAAELVNGIPQAPDLLDENPTSPKPSDSTQPTEGKISSSPLTREEYNKRYRQVSSCNIDENVSLASTNASPRQTRRRSSTGARPRRSSMAKKESSGNSEPHADDYASLRDSIHSATSSISTMTSFDIPEDIDLNGFDLVSPLPSTRGFSDMKSPLSTTRKSSSGSKRRSLTKEGSLRSFASPTPTCNDDSSVGSSKHQLRDLLTPRRKSTSRPQTREEAEKNLSMKKDRRASVRSSINSILDEIEQMDLDF